MMVILQRSHWLTKSSKMFSLSLMRLQVFQVLALLVLLSVLLNVATVDCISLDNKRIAREAHDIIPSTSAPTVISTTTTSIPVSVQADTNSTGSFFRNTWTENAGVIQRAFIVLGIMACIIVLYVGIRYFRERQRKNRSKKYGLITVPEDDRIEMAPLDYDDDDDDEDMTVFDQTSARKKRENGEASRPLRKQK